MKPSRARFRAARRVQATTVPPIPGVGSPTRRAGRLPWSVLIAGGRAPRKGARAARSRRRARRTAPRSNHAGASQAQLKTWDSAYGLRFRGVGFDWVEAEFTRQPSDMMSFAKQVYKFCPDVVDQGAGTVEKLAAEMARTNALYLWWD